MTLTVTAREIIEAAFRASGIVPTGQPLDDSNLERGREAFDYLLKSWQAQGLHLWARSEATLPLVTGKYYYDLGDGGAEVGTSDSFYATNLNADESSGDLSIIVYDVGGISAAPELLTFEITAATSGWTAINSATLSSASNKLTITNVGATAGGADYVLDTVTGGQYRLTLDYEKGTSSGATIAVISGATLATTSLTANGSIDLRFTANSDTVTLRLTNDSSTTGHDNTFGNVNYQLATQGDRIGIELDNGTRFWTNVISVTTAPPTIGLYSALTGDAATGNIVYTYSSGIDRPLRVYSVRYLATPSASEVPTEQMAREDYFNQPDKTSQGTISQWYYDPQLSLGRLYVWQAAASVNSVIQFTYSRPLSIPANLTDAPDIPAEWVNALKWNLAKELCYEYGLMSRAEVVTIRAAEELSLVLGFDIEHDSIQIAPYASY